MAHRHRPDEKALPTTYPERSIFPAAARIASDPYAVQFQTFCIEAKGLIDLRDGLCTEIQLARIQG